MGSWGTFVGRRPLPVLILGLLLVVIGAIYGGGVFGHLSDGGFDDPGSESARQARAAVEVFGNRTPDVIVSYGDPNRPATDREVRTEVERVVAGYPKSAVDRVVTGYQANDPLMFSRDGHDVQVVITLAGDSDTARSRNYRELEGTLRSTDLQTLVAGQFTVFAAGNDATARDLHRAELLSIPLVLILSLLIFGSVIAALMPLLVGVIAVIGALALVRLITGFATVSSFSINVIVLLGLGLAVDYALFIVSRFREELFEYRFDPDPDIAAVTRATMRTAGRTVGFSGLTVAAALSSLLVFPQDFLRSIAYGGMAAVLAAMVTALTVLPATLALLGRRIDALAIPLLNDHGRGSHSKAGRWERWAWWVMRRPVAVLIGTVVVLLAIGLPFLGVKWGGYDHRVLPTDTRAHQETTAMAAKFAPETSSASVTVAGVNDEGVKVFMARARGVGTVTDVREEAAKGDVALVRVTWLGGSQTQESQSIVRQLRALPEPDGARAVAVGGTTAQTVDMVDSIAARLPAMVLVVIAVMMVLMFLAFGSVVLPIKAILVAAVSLFASFGVVTWGFSDGHLAGPLGFTPTGALDPTVPILMLAVLFGLSMDYEVFLLSRVRDEWDATRDNTRSVAVGLAKTGRIITCAALLLGVVVGAFGTSGMVFMKVLGIGMLVALLVDATLVRGLLVPASMALLGRWNWWAPAPLRIAWEWTRSGDRRPEPGRPPRERS